MKRRVSIALLAAAAAFAAPIALGCGMDGQAKGGHGAGGHERHAADPHQAMTRMHQQMDAIADAQDPRERRRLVDEHTASMRDAMRSMQGCTAGEKAGAACTPQHGAKH